MILAHPFPQKSLRQNFFSREERIEELRRDEAVESLVPRRIVVRAPRVLLGASSRPGVDHLREATAASRTEHRQRRQRRRVGPAPGPLPRRRQDLQPRRRGGGPWRRSWTVDRRAAQRVRLFIYLLFVLLVFERKLIGFY